MCTAPLSTAPHHILPTSNARRRLSRRLQFRSLQVSLRVSHQADCARAGKQAHRQLVRPADTLSCIHYDDTEPPHHRTTVAASDLPGINFNHLSSAPPPEWAWHLAINLDTSDGNVQSYDKYDFWQRTGKGAVRTSMYTCMLARTRA